MFEHAIGIAHDQRCGIQRDDEAVSQELILDTCQRLQLRGLIGRGRGLES
jgi:hypothetical protein